MLSDLKREKKESSESIITDSNSYKQYKKPKRKKYIIAVSILIMLLLGFGAYYIFNNKTKEIKPAKHTQITYEGTIFFSGLPNLLTEITQISPDGRYTAYVVDNKKNRSIYIQENYSGKSFEIFSAWAIVCLRWSPDGNEIFFGAGFFDQEHSDLKNSKIYSPYIVSKSDWKPHPFNDGWCNGCWSPDNKYLALIFYVQDSIRIVNRKTQHLERSIKFIQDFNKIYDVDWSLNGFVCLTFSEKNKKFALWTIQNDGTQQKKIAESELGIFCPRWSADGNYIYYFQGRKNTVDLVKIKISSERTSVGGPKIILTGLQAWGYSLSKDNKKFVYTKDTRYSNIWEMTFETNQKSYRTNQLTNGTTYNSWLNISSDGEKITFVNQGNIFINSIEEGKIKQLTSFNSECWSPFLSPDGKEIAFLSASRDIVIVDTHEGLIQKTFRNIDFGTQLIWSSDSILLYSKLKDQNFYIFNMISGDRKTLIKNDTEKNSGEMSYPMYSPDRKKFILYWYKWTGNSGLWLISSDGSSEKLLFWGQIYPLKWSENNEMFYAYDFTKNPKEIIKVSSKNGTVVQRIKMPSEVDEADVTPDGKKIVYSIYKETSDVWMIENFDPDVD